MKLDQQTTKGNEKKSPIIDIKHSKETMLRTLVKSGSYRVLGSLGTGTSATIILHHVLRAHNIEIPPEIYGAFFVTTSSVDAPLKFTIQLLHERSFTHIKWG